MSNNQKSDPIEISFVSSWKRGKEAKDYHSGNLEEFTPEKIHSSQRKSESSTQRTLQRRKSTGFNFIDRVEDKIRRDSSPKLKPFISCDSSEIEEDALPNKNKGRKRRNFLKKMSSDRKPLAAHRAKMTSSSNMNDNKPNLSKLKTYMKSDITNSKVKDFKNHQNEIELLNRIEELKEKEKELLDSISFLNSSAKSFSSPIINRKKKDKDYKKININEISICERIGSGFSGAIVYSCIVDGWVCAMKQLSSENKIDLESFEREMTLLYQLPSHPNIVKYLFHTSLNGKLCLFMTRHHGTLQKLIHTKQETKQYFSQPEIIKIGLKIIKGIKFLHSHRIIHRDIKTENIYYTPDSSGDLKEVVIADFDTAKRTGVANSPQSTIGTLGYMAPEVFNNKNLETGYSFSADIFSFGMVLYSLLTLQEPYHTITNPFQIYKTILNGENPIITDDIKLQYSNDLIQLHINCIKIEPSERPTAAEISTFLKLELEKS